MAASVLAPGNPRLALVIHNSTVVWPQVISKNPIKFAELRSAYKGSIEDRDAGVIRYSRQEMCEIRDRGSRPASLDEQSILQTPELDGLLKGPSVSKLSSTIL